MDTSIDRLSISPPDYSENIPKEKNGNFARNAVLIISIILMLTSLTIHISVMFAGLSYICDKDNIENIFLQGILPDFTKIKTSSKEEVKKPEETEPIVDQGQTDLQIPNDKSSISMDLSTNNDHGFALKNETSYNPDLDILFNSPNPIEKTDKLYEKYTEDAPIVLIYHTHATESYIDTDDTGSFRSKDPKKNMIAIGAVISSVLDSEDIKNIHLTEMFDASSFNLAYNNSAAAVEKIIETYPSIKYVIDVHRDSVTDDLGNCISADFTYSDTIAAQLMFVVGTDEGGSNHTNWRNNLTTVLHLQDKLFSGAPSSVRPINLRDASFYQDKSAGAMLVEIGTCGNTLEEAKRGAVIFSSALAEYITGRDTKYSAADLMESLNLK